MDENFDALITSDDSEEKTEELMQLFRRDVTIAKTPDAIKGTNEGRIVPRRERVKKRNINVTAAIIALTVATAVTVGIPVLAAVLIVKAAKKEK